MFAVGFACGTACAAGQAVQPPTEVQPMVAPAVPVPAVAPPPAVAAMPSAPSIQEVPPGFVAAENEPIPNRTLSRPAIPEVPPLLPDERPPSDGPNYFEPGEISSGGIVTVFESCRESSLKASPTVSAERAASYCSCVTDGMRRNFHATGDITKALPTMDQIQQCGAAARTDRPSPFAFPPPRSTADVWRTWKGCPRVYGDRHGTAYCDCFVDAWFAGFNHPHAPVSSPVDGARCQVVDEYWAATKTHLTVRQFKALRPPSIKGTSAAQP
jgi:hypothetical protein